MKEYFKKYSTTVIIVCQPAISGRKAKSLVYVILDSK